MHIAWKKGFDRLFIIAALGWAIYALWYMPLEQWHERFDLESDRWSDCLSAAAQDRAQVEQCNADHKKNIHELPQTAWTGFGWHGWLFLVAFAVVPPVIVYWLLHGVDFVFRGRGSPGVR